MSMSCWRGPRRPGCRAYTLAELIIVIAVLGLASAIVVPSLQNEDSSDVQAAVRKLIGDLSFAQTDALAHQEFRRVHFYEDGRGYCITRESAATFRNAFDGDTADYITDPLGSAGAIGRYIVDYSLDARFRNLEIESVSIDVEDGRDIIYDALGGTVNPTVGGAIAPGAGGTVVMVSGRFRYEVTIAAFTGKLTVTRLPDAGE